MLKIGITGGIGSGKTTVSQLFELLGVPVFYADDEGKNVMTKDPGIKQAIQESLGLDAYFADGTLNRKYIASIVFHDENKLQQLNSLVHPAVFKSFEKWAQSYRNVAYVLKEAALLFEANSYKMCDYTILVTAPLETRIARVIKRDGVSRQQVESRNEKQFTQEQKLAFTDFIIDNSGNELLIPQVLTMHQHFLTAIKRDI